MRVVVNDGNIEQVLSDLLSIESGVIVFDTETFGLKWDDILFALQLKVRNGSAYYFNFLDYAPINAPALSRDIFKRLKALFMKPNIRWVAHNAKFDMRRLDIEGIRINGEVYDTMVMAHVLYNKHMSYSLDNCLKRIGLEKDDRVMKWITENKAYTTYHVEGKKTKEKDLHFDRVPWHIMCEYGFRDVEDTLALYLWQEAYFNKSENQDQIDLIHNNIELVKAVYNMEAEGISISEQYCIEAAEEHARNVQEITDDIERLTQQKYKAGSKWLKEILHDQGIELEVSDKGNVILDKNALKQVPNAIAHLVLEMRDQEKHGTFYSTFLRFKDRSGILHPSYRLTGTDTGRFSCSDPNLQQVPKEEKAIEEGHTVRGAFYVDPEFYLVSMDYDQMEYRMMADYAGEMGMIEAIKGGLDPHTYVAQMMGVDRKLAKTLNFGLLYGMGLAKLADALNVSIDQAKVLKYRYYKELPNVQRLTRTIMDTAIARGYIRNRYNRRYYLDDPKFAYKMPNYLIQGTGADVVRHVIPKIDYMLEGAKSKLLLQVHDELIFKIHRQETHLIPEIRRIMESEYKPMNGMNLTCGVEYSEDNTWRTSKFKVWKE